MPRTKEVMVINALKGPEALEEYVLLCEDRECWRKALRFKNSSLYAQWSTQNGPTLRLAKITYELDQLLTIEPLAKWSKAEQEL
jgi:hypothetical protein